MYQAACAMHDRGWATNRRELASLLLLNTRAANEALQTVERRGVVRRRWKGPKKGGRFFLEVTNLDLLDPSCDANLDLLDPSSVGPCTSDHTRASDPDPSSSASGDHFKQNPPSILRGSRGRDGGRVEISLELEHWAARLWPELPTAVARLYLVELIKWSPDEPTSERIAFLRAGKDGRSAEFAGLERASVWLAALCSKHRVQRWFARRRKERPRAAPSSTSSRAAPSSSSTYVAQLEEARRKAST